VSDQHDFEEILVQTRVHHILHMGCEIDLGARKVRSISQSGNGRHRREKSRNAIGYAYIHSASDDHSRLAYSEVLANERKETAAAFCLSADAFFERYA